MIEFASFVKESERQTKKSRIHRCLFFFQQRSRSLSLSVSLSLSNHLETATTTMRLSTTPESSRAGTAVPRRVEGTAAPRNQCRSRRLHRPIAASVNDSPSSPSSSQRKRLAVFVSGGGSNLRAIHAATQDGRVDADVVVRKSLLERRVLTRFFSNPTGHRKNDKNKKTQPLQLPTSLPTQLKPQVVVSDVPGCGGWTWAQDQGIETRVFPPLETRGAGKAELRNKAAAELADELLLSPGDRGDEQRRESSGSASPSASSPGFGVDVVALAGYLKLVPSPLVRAFPRRMLNIHPALLPGPFGGKGFYGIKVHEAVLASGARFSGPTVHFVDEVFDRGPILAQRAVPVMIPGDDAKKLAARVLAAEHEVFPGAIGALCAGKVKWTEGGIPYY